MKIESMAKHVETRQPRRLDEGSIPSTSTSIKLLEALGFQEFCYILNLLSHRIVPKSAASHLPIFSGPLIS